MAARVGKHITPRGIWIGGASAAARAGADIATIQAIGGWKSDVVQRYLRSLQFAKSGGSRGMGFG